MKVALFAMIAVAASCWAIDIRHAQDIQPARTGTVAPGVVASQENPATEASHAAEPARGAERLLGVWQTNVPGAVYISPSSQPGFGTLQVSSGAVSGLLRLSPDGTYSWNSHGGKSGRWVFTGQPEYPIQIIDTAENRHWSVGLDARTGELVVWSGSVWYRGRRAAVR